jgi:hypothetical protein
MWKVASRKDLAESLSSTPFLRTFMLCNASHCIGTVIMTISSSDVLSSHLKPLCPRDNRVMSYESRDYGLSAGDRGSYHCGFEGCSVRYSTKDGYYMLIGMPDHPNAVGEPGVNTRVCPRHGRWLYLRKITDREAGARWSCGVEGCDYCYHADTKGDWVRN